MPLISWIASYPRSGNTWTRFMLTSYLMNAPLTSANVIEDTIPDFHFLVKTGCLHPLMKDGIELVHHGGSRAHMIVLRAQ